MKENVRENILWWISAQVGMSSQHISDIYERYRKGHLTYKEYQHHLVNAMTDKDKNKVEESEQCIKYYEYFIKLIKDDK